MKARVPSIGIDHPAVAAGAGDGAELLADDAVVGKARQRSAFRMARSAARSAAVTGSKPVAPALLLTASAPAKMRQDGLAGNIRQYMGEFEVDSLTALRAKLSQQLTLMAW